MKAINCTQCGATIDDVSEHSLIIHCDYCGARIMLNSVPVPLKTPEPIRRPPVDTPDFEIESPAVSTFKVVMYVIAGVAFLPAVIGIAISMFSPKPSTPASAYTPPATPFGYPTPSSWSVPTVPAKPVPVVNYQPRISWDGPNDLEHFDNPDVDISSVSHLTTEEVKNTVFKNRTVKLRVVINTEGEIDTVETISGHPLLVEAATASAKRSIFSSRSKPTTRVLTYTFRVLKD